MSTTTYRMVPSEKAGYAPGKHVVQYHDPVIGRWFDVGDPLTEDAARARLRDRRDGAAASCSHPHTRPASKGDQRPYCVSCLTIVAPR